MRYELNYSVHTVYLRKDVAVSPFAADGTTAATAATSRTAV